jgi:hypothetical protein
MKKFIILLALLIASPAFGATWCKWSGTEATDCKSDSRKYISVDTGLPIGPESYAAYGYYELQTITPVIGADQIRDEIQWSFDGTIITRTWTVRDMTTEELDAREAKAMRIGEYYLWKALIAKDVITQQEAAQALPQELIDAYLARKRIEEQ